MSVYYNFVLFIVYFDSIIFAYNLLIRLWTTVIGTLMLIYRPWLEHIG